MILSDFTCPVHGRFEALAPADAETAPCPHAPVSYSIGPAHGFEGPRQYFTDTCGIPSPWSPTAPAVHTAFVVSATQGKSDPPPSPLAMNTRPLMEGQRYSEWRKERKKVWREHDWKQRKERG